MSRKGPRIARRPRRARTSRGAYVLLAVGVLAVCFVSSTASRSWPASAPDEQDEPVSDAPGALTGAQPNPQQVKTCQGHHQGAVGSHPTQLSQSMTQEEHGPLSQQAQTDMQQQQQQQQQQPEPQQQLKSGSEAGQQLTTTPPDTPTPDSKVEVASDAALSTSPRSGRGLRQFFNQVGLGGQVGFPFFLDIVLNIFDGVGYAGVVRPVSTAVDRSLAQTQLCTGSASARANLATCNNIPGFNALAVAG